MYPIQPLVPKLLYLHQRMLYLLASFFVAQLVDPYLPPLDQVILPVS